MQTLMNTKLIASSDADCSQMTIEEMEVNYPTQNCSQPTHELIELHIPKSKPIIVLINAAGSKKLDKHVYEGIDALAAWNDPPKLFQRGGRLVDICKDGLIYKIVEVPQKSLKLILAEAAIWINLVKAKDEKSSGKKDKESKSDIEENNLTEDESLNEEFSEKRYMDSEIPQKKFKYTIDYPNDSIVGAILEASSRWKNIPYLYGLTNLPIPRPDGSIYTKHGFDKITGYYFTPRLDMPEIPDDLTKDYAIYAADFLQQELFSDFPLKDAASRANMLAALITPALRPICGITPLFAITKPSPGEGSSLLVDIISRVCTGNDAPIRDANSRDDEEWRRTIFSLLRGGTLMSNFDNLDQSRKFETPVMASFLTSNMFNDRILGQSTTVSYYNNMVSFLTGRNIKLGGDIPRRTVLIELEEMDRKLLQNPSLRNFRHARIKEWTLENRPVLVYLILTMFKAWAIAGKPVSSNVPIIGSFETWCTTIGGILEYAGIPSFLGNRQTVYDEMDSELNEWNAFAITWQSNENLAGYVTARQLLDEIQKSPNMRDAIPSEIEQAVKCQNARSLGNALRSQKDVSLGDGLVIRVKKDSHTKSSVYMVEGISTAN